MSETAPKATPQVAGRQVIHSAEDEPATPASVVSVPTTGPANASHYRDGHLTREGMEHVIRSGGSVVKDGKIYSQLSHIPSPAEFAKASGDKDEVARVRRDMQAQVDKLNQEIADLKKSGTGSTVTIESPTNGASTQPAK